MAAAEALYDTRSSASFSLFTLGNLDGSKELFSLRIPNLLSFMATASPGGTVQGINDVQAAYQAKYEFADYTPYVPMIYWSFRLMVGFGLVATLVALVGLVALRGGRTPRSPWFWRALTASLVLPFLANSFGWIFTELGRQPWSVFGLLTTSSSVSPSVSLTEALISLISFTLLYGVLAVIDLRLMVRYAKAGPPSDAEVLAGLEPPAPPDDPARPTDTSSTDPEHERPLVFAY